MRGAALLLLAALLPACAERPANEGGRPERLPDLPDAFRAELRGGLSPGCPLRGQAVYLGEGRFLTAAHLVDDVVPRLRGCTGHPIPTTIRYAGHTIPVSALRIGKGVVEPGVGPLYRNGEDLALLQATTPLPGPAARPCGAWPGSGNAVVVLSSGRRTALAGDLVPESRASDGAYADIALHLSEGESGAGVFDPATHCLLGIVSHRPDATPDHSRIVPVETIRAFLGG